MPDQITREELKAKMRKVYLGELHGVPVYLASVDAEEIMKLVDEYTAERERQRDSTVTRFEVVDHRDGSPTLGRAFVSYGVSIERSYQDDNRTLKVFVTNTKKEEV